MASKVFGLRNLDEDDTLSNWRCELRMATAEGEEQKSPRHKRRLTLVEVGVAIQTCQPDVNLGRASHPSGIALRQM